MQQQPQQAAAAAAAAPPAVRVEVQVAARDASTRSLATQAGKRHKWIASDMSTSRPMSSVAGIVLRHLGLDASGHCVILYPDASAHAHLKNTPISWGPAFDPTLQLGDVHKICGSPSRLHFLYHIIAPELHSPQQGRTPTCFRLLDDGGRQQQQQQQEQQPGQQQRQQQPAVSDAGAQRHHEQQQRVAEPQPASTAEHQRCRQQPWKQQQQQQLQPAAPVSAPAATATIASAAQPAGEQAVGAQQCSAVNTQQNVAQQPVRQQQQQAGFNASSVGVLPHHAMPGQRQQPWASHAQHTVPLQLIMQQPSFPAALHSQQQQQQQPHHRHHAHHAQLLLQQQHARGPLSVVGASNQQPRCVPVSQSEPSLASQRHSTASSYPASEGRQGAVQCLQQPGGHLACQGSLMSASNQQQQGQLHAPLAQQQQQANEGVRVPPQALGQVGSWATMPQQQQQQQQWHDTQQSRQPAAPQPQPEWQGWSHLQASCPVPSSGCPPSSSGPVCCLQQRQGEHGFTSSAAHAQQLCQPQHLQQAGLVSRGHQPPQQHAWQERQQQQQQPAWVLVQTADGEMVGELPLLLQEGRLVLQLQQQHMPGQPPAAAAQNLLQLLGAGVALQTQQAPQQQEWEQQQQLPEHWQQQQGHSQHTAHAPPQQQQRQQQCQDVQGAGAPGPQQQQQHAIAASRQVASAMQAPAPADEPSAAAAAVQASGLQHAPPDATPLATGDDEAAQHAASPAGMLRSHCSSVSCDGAAGDASRHPASTGKTPAAAPAGQPQGVLPHQQLLQPGGPAGFSGSATRCNNGPRAVSRLAPSGAATAAAFGAPAAPAASDGGGQQRSEVTNSSQRRSSSSISRDSLRGRGVLQPRQLQLTDQAPASGAMSAQCREQQQPVQQQRHASQQAPPTTSSWQPALQAIAEHPATSGGQDTDAQKEGHSDGGAGAGGSEGGAARYAAGRHGSSVSCGATAAAAGGAEGHTAGGLRLELSEAGEDEQVQPTPSTAGPASHHAASVGTAPADAPAAGGGRQSAADPLDTAGAAPADGADGGYGDDGGYSDDGSDDAQPDDDASAGGGSNAGSLAAAEAPSLQQQQPPVWPQPGRQANEAAGAAGGVGACSGLLRCKRPHSKVLQSDSAHTPGVSASQGQACGAHGTAGAQQEGQQQQQQQQATGAVDHDGFQAPAPRSKRSKSSTSSQAPSSSHHNARLAPDDSIALPSIVVQGRSCNGTWHASTGTWDSRTEQTPWQPGDPTGGSVLSVSQILKMQELQAQRQQQLQAQRQQQQQLQPQQQRRLGPRPPGLQPQQPAAARRRGPVPPGAARVDVQLAAPHHAGRGSGRSWQPPQPPPPQLPCWGAGMTPAGSGSGAQDPAALMHQLDDGQALGAAVPVSSAGPALSLSLGAIRREPSSSQVTTGAEPVHPHQAVQPQGSGGSQQWVGFQPPVAAGAAAGDSEGLTLQQQQCSGPLSVSSSGMAPGDGMPAGLPAPPATQPPTRKRDKRRAVREPQPARVPLPSLQAALAAKGSRTTLSARTAPARALQRFAVGDGQVMLVAGSPGAAAAAAAQATAGNPAAAAAPGCQQPQQPQQLHAPLMPPPAGVQGRVQASAAPASTAADAAAAGHVPGPPSPRQISAALQGLATQQAAAAGGSDAATQRQQQQPGCTPAHAPPATAALVAAAGKQTGLSGFFTPSQLLSPAGFTPLSALLLPGNGGATVDCLAAMLGPDRGFMSPDQLMHLSSSAFPSQSTSPAGMHYSPVPPPKRSRMGPPAPTGAAHAAIPPQSKDAGRSADQQHQHSLADFQALYHCFQEGNTMQQQQQRVGGGPQANAPVGTSAAAAAAAAPMGGVHVMAVDGDSMRDVCHYLLGDSTGSFPAPEAGAATAGDGGGSGKPAAAAAASASEQPPPAAGAAPAAKARGGAGGGGRAKPQTKAAAGRAAGGGARRGNAKPRKAAAGGAAQPQAPPQATAYDPERPFGVLFDENKGAAE